MPTRSHLLLPAFLFLTLLPAYGQTALDSFILAEMEARKIPGISACIIQDGQLAWTGHYGFANLDQQIPVGPQTIFMLASISKTVTATALMQLHEAGMFSLDDPVNDYLPFEVINPNHPDSAITILQLMTHTSSLKDNWNVLEAYYTPGDSPIPLGDFLEGYFVPGGPYYNQTKNFYSYAPGANDNYCNMAVALCGYLVETISGMPFNTYCNQNIFTPLCMDQTGWFLSELDSAQIARPYSYFQGNYHDQGLYGYPDYPDGQLRTTAVSLAKFLWMNMNQGHFDGTQILDSATVSLIRTPATPAINPTQGLVWYYFSDSGADWWGHNGGDAGVSTDMYFHEASQTGIVLLTNSDSPHGKIWDALVAHADTINASNAPEMACVIDFPSSVTETSYPAIRLFPNPAAEELFLPEGFAVQSATIYHATGQVCMKWENTTASLPVGHLPGGVYSVVFQGLNGEKYLGRFVKL